jgi:amino acid adenylation domain-containing protein
MASDLHEVDFDPFAGGAVSSVIETTEAQREIWLADQLGREASLSYNESVSICLDGPLDRLAVQSALDSLIGRHESLRATFSPDGLKMLVQSTGKVSLRVVDLSHEDDAAAESHVAQLRLLAVEDVFDLLNGPLFRATIVVRGVSTSELILSGHHIVCDGWSFGVLVSELLSLYRQNTGGDSLKALPAPEKFSDYVLMQAEPDAIASAEQDALWWARKFVDGGPILELPVDHPRPSIRSFESLREDIFVESNEARVIREFGSRSGSSLFVTMFSAFSALISRLTGQDDIVIGVPAAGQAAAGKHSLVGHCVNLLPVRLGLDMAKPFDQHLAACRTAVLDAYEHQSCTFGNILRKLTLARDPGRSPLVSVLFNLDSPISADDLRVGALQSKLHSNPRRYENFELFLNISQTADGFTLECQYNTQLFDRETIRRWLSLYCEMFRRLEHNSNQAVAQIVAPTQQDLNLLAKFNGTDAVCPADVRIESLISRAATASPDSIAITSGEIRMSYRELEQRSNAVALRLREMGVKCGDLVGLACGRNQHMFVGLVGILKAGAGYVPMDPAFPADRLQYMSDDAKAKVLVSDRSVVDLPDLPGIQRLIVDDLGAVVESVVIADGSAADVAYVIYTSGSTGRPKGVRVPHSSVVNLLASVAREPGMTRDNVVLSVTTLSFDIAVSEVILPLTVGARVVVASRTQTTDGDQLRALVEKEDVDFIDATPSTWRLLLAAGWLGSGKIKAICTGEPLPPDLGLLLLPCVSELWNGYGPTETTVWSSFFRVREITGVVPIGQPIANTQIHVVDSQCLPVPIGVVGELYIGGVGVTLGYLGRPDLTKERFLPDPHRPGAMWYRTGDLGRWRMDGVLECLGRTDHQVKVRGYRIELGEIESNLLKHPDVERAIVVTREDEPGDVRLVAYVVSREASIDDFAMRDFLRGTLPDYMVPSHLVVIPAIPLLPNGKINRKELPRPDGQSGSTRSKSLPRTELESAVLSAMEGVLKLPGLGRDDDFFRMGGHSLLAARLIARLNRDFGINLPLRIAFEAPTAERLAVAVQTAQRGAVDGARHIGIPVRSDQTTAPLTTMQERIRFMEELHPGRVVYNTPSAHRLKGVFDLAAFRHAFSEIVRRQSSLRTSIRRAADGMGYHQQIELMPEIKLPLTDLSAYPDVEREAELLRQLQAIIDKPIAISQGPLFAAALFRMAEEEHVFLFMPHHIIWDGWSFDLLYQEISELYSATLEGRAPKLEPLEVSYGDYAAWHANWLLGKECQQQIAFWKKRYAGLPALRSMPVDKPRQAGMSGVGAVEWVHVDKALTEQLRSAALKADLTLNMLTLATHAMLISQATDSPVIVLGMPVRGRLRSEVENVMGFFNNLLPFNVTVSPDLPVFEWAGRVKQEMMDLFANQEVPFEKLSMEPEFSGASQRMGLYQSLFSFQDARERVRNWGGLQHQSVLVMQKGATEDFGLWLMDVPHGLEGGINYNADIFESSTAAMFRERYVSLLKRIVAMPNATVRQILEAPGADASQFVAWLVAKRQPEPAQKAKEIRNSRTPARQNGELQIARIWSDLLGIDAEQISSQDNFFDLGGNSMLAMQAIERTSRELGLQIDPQRYLVEPLSKLATGVATNAATSDSDVGKLATIWAELLGLEPEQISGTDNFFDLGGNSLLVMRAIASGKERFGFEVEPQRYVMETLAQLAQQRAAAPEAKEKPSGGLKSLFGAFRRDTNKR